MNNTQENKVESTQATAKAKAKPSRAKAKPSQAKAKPSQANVLQLGQFRASIPVMHTNCQSANCAIGRVASALGKDSTARKALGADLASISSPDLAAVRKLKDAGSITAKDAAIYCASVQLAKAIQALQASVAK